MATVGEEIQEMELEEELELEAPAPEVQQPGFDFWAWLQKPTGEGSIESYMDHPMNVTQNKGGARVVRGLTGLLGDLRLAVVDILMGLVDLWRGRQQQAPPAPPAE